MSEKKNIEELRLVEELHAQARRNFPRRHVIVCIQWLVASGFDRIQEITIMFLPLLTCWTSIGCIV